MLLFTSTRRDGFNLTHDIPHIELTYTDEDFQEWVSGRRERWLPESPPKHVVNQPRYHFAEYFVLAYFRSRGWRGHRFYALGEWEPANPKLIAGRADIKRLFPAEQLAVFNRARAVAGRADGTGEPDLFLFREDGATMFVEVKKDKDRLAHAQIECLEQIRSLLGSQVCIAHLRKGKASTV